MTWRVAAVGLVHRRARFSCTIGVLALAACTRAAHSAPPVAARVVASVVLNEPPPGRLARPSSVTEAPNGDLLVADRESGQIFEYRADGEFIRAIGRKGPGPGEFQGPRSVVPLSDTTFVAFDPVARNAQRFTISGAPYGPRISLPVDFTMATRGADGSVWIGGANMASHYALLRWDLRTDTLAASFPLPKLYDQYPLFELLGGAVVNAASDTLLVGFGAGDELYRVSATNGSRLDSIDVPAVRRRGIPNAALQYAREGDGYHILDAASSLTAIARTPTGDILLAYRDLSHNRNAFNFLGSVYVTMLHHDLRPACLDIPVPQLDNIAPIIGFAGDTLLVLEEPVNGQDSLHVVVRRVVFDRVGGCG